MKLIALDDAGNRFGDAMQDEFAEWEREEIAKRTQDRLLEKCRSGLVIKRKRAAYGYRASEGGNALEVSEPEMEVVRRIFRSVAEGTSVRSARLSLEREGVAAPSGILRWNHTTIRNILTSDLYAPHTVAEVAEVVEPAVAARLEGDASTGCGLGTPAGARGAKSGTSPPASSRSATPRRHGRERSGFSCLCRPWAYRRRSWPVPGRASTTTLARP